MRRLFRRPALEMSSSEGPIRVQATPEGSAGTPANPAALMTADTDQLATSR